MQTTANTEHTLERGALDGADSVAASRVGAAATVGIAGATAAWAYLADAPPGGTFWVPLALAAGGVSGWFAASASRVTADASSPTDDLERADRRARAVRGWIVAAMALAALAGLSRTREVVFRDNTDFGPAVLAPLVLALGLATLVRDDRARTAWKDRRRAERRESRAPERVAAERAGRASRLDAARGTTARTSARLAKRPRLSRALDAAAIAFGVVGFVPCMFWFGVGGTVAYPLGVLILVTAAHLVDTRRGWTQAIPVAANEQRDAERRIRSSRRPWSAAPPRDLRRVRAVFLVVVSLGFAFGVLAPLLTAAAPPDRYRGAAAFVVLFLASLVPLGVAESQQRRREEAWMRENAARRKERSP